MVTSVNITQSRARGIIMKINNENSLRSSSNIIVFEELLLYNNEQRVVIIGIGGRADEKNWYVNKRR